MALIRTSGPLSVPSTNCCSPSTCESPLVVTPSSSSTPSLGVPSPFASPVNEPGLAELTMNIGLDRQPRVIRTSVPLTASGESS